MAKPRGRPFPKGVKVGPGRPKGIPNKATVEIKQAARALLEDPAYVEALRARLQTGDAGPVESLLYHYAYGKPKETVAIEGRLKPLVIDLVTEGDVVAARERRDAGD